MYNDETGHTKEHVSLFLIQKNESVYGCIKTWFSTFGDIGRVTIQQLRWKVI